MQKDIFNRVTFKRH